jgi:3-isopropylmalate/(R)-2-methylmalate dehydratase large subunit
VPHTLSEKIIARAAGKEALAPGEIVTCKVDLAMMHDLSGPQRQKARLEAIGTEVWDPERVVIITDHFVTESDPDSLRIQSVTRTWAGEKGIRRFHENEGICHIVLPQAGYLHPGMFLVGGDSHSPTAGAFGCFMIGIGATDLASVLATGEIWVRVPHTIRTRVSGTLGRGVAAKDVILDLCHRIGINGANYQVVEFEGAGVDAMSMDERMVLTNMTAELGAKTGIIAPDGKTFEWLESVGVETDVANGWRSDGGANYVRTLEVDAATLAPQVAAPHSPENARPVDEHAGTRIDQAYLGACTGAKLDDLRMAAEVVRGRKVAKNVHFFVAPSSYRIREQAAAEGTLEALESAGATVLPTGCGACIGLGPARLGAGKVQVSSTSRNFRGRMGDPASRTYLASAYTVAASAVAGGIADPREFLS